MTFKIKDQFLHLKHFYYSNIQKLCRFEALSRPEILCSKISRFLDLVNDIYIFAYRLANVGMMPEALSISYVLEYAQIAQSEPKSMILIEGRSSREFFTITNRCTYSF